MVLDCLPRDHIDADEQDLLLTDISEDHLLGPISNVLEVRYLSMADEISSCHIRHYSSLDDQSYLPHCQARSAEEHLQQSQCIFLGEHCVPFSNLSSRTVETLFDDPNDNVVHQEVTISN